MSMLKFSVELTNQFVRVSPESKTVLEDNSLGKCETTVLKLADIDQVKLAIADFVPSLIDLGNYQNEKVYHEYYARFYVEMPDGVRNLFKELRDPIKIEG